MPDGEFRLVCHRWLGLSCQDCDCRLAGEGWLSCPAEARKKLPKIDEHLELWDAVWSAPAAATQIYPPLRSDIGGFSSRGRDAAIVALTRNVAATVPELKVTTVLSISAKPARNLSGDICHDCGSPNMIRTGTCLTCGDCGSSSGGCS